MDLIIGGVYQGKTEYTIQKYHLAPHEIYSCAEVTDNLQVAEGQIVNARCVDHLELYLLECIREGQKPLAPSAYRKDAVLICEDIFCGIVPVDPIERRWREETGRYLQKVSRQAARVVRVICGIGTGIIPEQTAEDVSVSTQAATEKAEEKIVKENQAAEKTAPEKKTEDKAEFRKRTSSTGKSACISKKILLIRHGSTEMSEAHMYCGSSDPSLSAGGAAALEALRGRYAQFAGGSLWAEFPARRGRNLTMASCEDGIILADPISEHAQKASTAFYTSGMKRADETMEILFGEESGKRSDQIIYQEESGKRSDQNIYQEEPGERSDQSIYQEEPGERSDQRIYSAEQGEESHQKMYKVEPGLKEIDLGAFEGRTYEELKCEPAYQAWISGDNEKNICPGGESAAQMKRRAWAAFERIVRSEEAEQIVMVIHGGPITAILMQLMPNLSENRFRWQPDYGGSWFLEVLADGEGIVCRTCVPYV